MTEPRRTPSQQIHDLIEQMCEAARVDAYNEGLHDGRAEQRERIEQRVSKLPRYGSLCGGMFVPRDVIAAIRKGE